MSHLVSFSNRGRFELISTLLQLCDDHPARRTHLMYAANLNHAQLKKYLGILIAKGFCIEDDDARVRITDKGHVFLTEYTNLATMLGD
jgi:predicted transcriptional regulator